MNGQKRKNIKPGIEVEVVLKVDQATGKLTKGKVEKILTNKSYHPRGIKVQLTNGQVGRVQNIIEAKSDLTQPEEGYVVFTG